MVLIIRVTMKFKSNQIGVKKIIGVLAAVAILMTSIPMGAFFTNVSASSDSNLIDFEGPNSSAIVDGNDAFSITGQDSEDKFYFYAKNKTSDTLTLTFDDIQLETGKQYTLDLDIYTLRVSKDDNDVLLGLKMYGESECSLEKQIKNTDICEENWANYHATFTAKDEVNKLDFSIYTIGKVFVDNFVLIDENGKETAIDAAAACEATELKDHFSMATLYDIAYEEPDIIDGYLKAAVPVNSNTSYNEAVDIPMNLTKSLDKGRYTVSVDLKFTSLGSCRDAFCASVAGADYGIIQQKWLNAVDITLNKYNTYTFELDLTPEHTYFRLNVYQGCTAYIDNLALIDPAGIEVVRFDFDEPVNFNGSAYEQKGIAKTQAASAALYSRLVSATVAMSESDDYAVLVDNSAGTGYDSFWMTALGYESPNLPLGKKYTISFDWYAEKVGTTNNGSLRVGKAHWNTETVIQENDTVWFDLPTETGSWVTITKEVTAIDVIGAPFIYVGAGVKGYLDNFKITDGDGTVHTNVEFTANDLGKISNCATVANLPQDIAGKRIPAYKMVFDANEIFRTADTSCTESITVTFDYYLASGAITTNSANTGDNDLFKSSLELGVHSFAFNAGSETRSFKLTATEASELYIWNVKVVTDGTEQKFANRTDRTDCEFSEITYADIPFASDDFETSTNDVLLIDTTAVDNKTPNSFWFNELGMSGYGALANGTYTIQFDVYPIIMPSGGNLFHYRTGNGSGPSSDTGWWKPDMAIEEWTTTSSTFTVTDATTSGNHILYVYGGFKGYIDNLRLLDSNGNEVAGTYTDITGLTVPDMYKDYLKIETLTTEDDGEETETNDVLLVDTTSVADDGSANKSFWFNELGMKGYGDLPNGTYTVKFDVCPITLAQSGTKFHFRTSNGQAEGAWAGFWKPNLTIGKWTTTSSTFTVTDATTSGNHILFVYGGFKGYIDNLVIIDSNGNEVAGTYTDMSGLTVPDKYKDYLKIESIAVSDNDDNDNVLSSGMNIAILRGRAGKNGASIKLGGAKSPLTIKSNTTYKLSFQYYQANPTDSGILNLFGIDTGFDNEITYFKKNNTTGWATGTVYFTTGEITDAVADWFEIVLNPNAWVYFDNFKLAEQEIDNNKAVSVIDFEEKDDAIYPDLIADNCTFGQTTDFSGTSNGGNGYFCASNAREYTNDTKNSNQKYQFGGIKLKSNTTYRVSIDYYVAKPITDYAFAIGYSQTNVGSGSGDSWQIWGNNISVVGWSTESFVFTTGDVVPNAGYINLVIYDTLDSTNPRVMYFDNLTFTELYRIDSTSNNSDLGTVSSTRTVEAGSDSKVVANPYEGVTFEGWYEYGDLVSTDEIYRIENVDDNHKLVAHFSGTPVKPDRIVQGFEDYDLGDILYEYYEIVDDPENVLEGKQSLHVKEDKIEVNADHSVFFPLVSNVETQLKEDTEYDVYVWIKPTKEPESTTYFQIVHSTSIADMSDLLTSPGGTGMQRSIKPVKAAADGEENGWYKFLIGTVTKSMATRQGFGIQVCKFHAFRAEGASIDDLYIDMVELVERVPDYANLKFTENLFNEITNSDFEDAVTNEDWAPLTDGVSIENVTNKEYDWQGSKQMVFDAAASNGQEYVRVIPIAKADKNYTFAAWTKLSAGSDISVGLYKNGNYEKFENVVNGENGTLGLVDDGKWNRVSFTFNSGENENAYLVIKGTKGTLELDMVELFIATRGYTKDPNSYGATNTVLQMNDPIAFPDVVQTVTTFIEDEDTSDDTYDDNDDDSDTSIDDEDDGDVEKTKKKVRVLKRRKGGNSSVWVWIGIGAGALAVTATVVFIILFAKRKKTKKEAK